MIGRARERHRRQPRAATDLAQTNSVLLRAEGRFGVFLESLKSIRKVALAA